MARYILRHRHLGLSVFAVCIVVFVEPSVWVATGMNFPQGLDVDVRVYLRRFHALMAKHGLDVSDVGAAAMHVGRAGVPPKVT